MVQLPQSYCKKITLKRRRRSKRPRKVWKIESTLRRVQRRIAIWLRSNAAQQPACVTAFRKGSSALENAKVHIQGPLVAVADLTDFYASISTQDVVELFESLKASRQVALTLARLCTIDGALTQGGRASPHIANLVGERLDNILLKQIPLGCKYTRYVDDLTFSGDAVPSEADLQRWINEAGFRIRHGSFKKKNKKAGPYVTGLNVGGARPEAPRIIRRRIERFLHVAQKYGRIEGAEQSFLRILRCDRAETAFRYIEGVCHWLHPIDKDTAEDWLKRIAALRAPIPTPEPEDSQQ